jgi:hypothetical protein
MGSTRRWLRPGDWIVNATTGYHILESKVPIVAKLLTYAQNTHTGLPALTSLQIEDMSLGFYSGFAKYDSQGPLLSLQSQYYFPACTGTVSGKICNGGVWQWSVNTLSKGAKSVAYVNAVRTIQPNC